MLCSYFWLRLACFVHAKQKDKSVCKNTRSTPRRQGPWRLPPTPRRQGPWRLAPGLRKTSFCAFQKPCGLSPLAQITCSRTQTFRETSGTPSDGLRNLSGDQTLLSTYQSLLPDNSGVPCHICDLFQNSKQHSVIKSHNS